MFPLAIGLGPNEIAIIVLLVVLLFGVKKLPEIGRGLAEGIHEFKKAARKATEEDKPESTSETQEKS